MSYVRVRTIVREVAKFYGVQMGELQGPKRYRSLVWPRHVAIYLSRQRTEASYPELGFLFGRRDHSTTINAVHRVEERLAISKTAEAEVQALGEVLDGLGIYERSRAVPSKPEPLTVGGDT